MDKQEIIDYLYSFNTHADITIEEMADDLAIPSAEPKTGHWIERRNRATGHIEIVCSECGAEKSYPYNDYCGNCGAKMFESQEGANE